MKLKTFILAGSCIVAGYFSLAMQVSGQEYMPTFDQNDVVLVVGGSGKSGRHLTEQLTAMGVAVRPTTRNLDRAKSEINSEYHWVYADVTVPSTLTTAFEGVTHVISTITDIRAPQEVDYQGNVNLVDAAKASGIKHLVIISSAGVTHEEHRLNQMFNDILKRKYESEEYLRNSGLNYTVVRPYGLNDTLVSEDKTRGILLLQGDAGPNGFILRSDVARVSIAALTHPDANGKTFEIFNFFSVQPKLWANQLIRMKED